jgi:hypothetical protein
VHVRLSGLNRAGQSDGYEQMVAHEQLNGGRDGPRCAVGDVGTVTCRRITAADGHDDWIDLRLIHGTRVSIRVSTDGEYGVPNRSHGTRNALDERLDGIENAGKLLDGQAEHGDGVVRRGRRRGRTLSSVALDTGLSTLSERIGGRG